VNRTHSPFAPNYWIMFKALSGKLEEYKNHSARKPFQVLNVGDVPNLPGYNPQVHKQRHHRQQKWSFINGQRIEVADGLTHDKPRMAKVPKPRQAWCDGTTIPKSTTRDNFYQPEPLTEEQPAWRAYDRHVLRFWGYFKEAVEESNLENERVRPIVMYYYLEDDTMHILEPSIENSGLGTRVDMVKNCGQPGVLLRRHRVLAPDTEGLGECGYLSPKDFHVGRTVTVYGKTFFLTDCDEFTRSFYGDRGVAQPPPQPLVEDTFLQTRRQAVDTKPRMARTYEKLYRETVLGGGHINKDMQQFLEKDRMVCRFFAVLDDLLTPQYERRPFTILYFLCDDTIEIREHYPLNAGRDNFPVFFRRSKLLKGDTEVRGPLEPPLENDAYVSLDDLAVGATLPCLALNLFLYDADAFTRAYYAEEIGRDLQEKIDVRIPDPIPPRPPTPPYTGYGNWEDSLASVTDLMMKVPKKDFHKYMSKDGQVLRFTAQFADPAPEDVQRRFVFKYFLNEDSIAIHEPPQRNLGIVTGKFLEKGIHLNQQTKAIFRAEDLLPGNMVSVMNHKFIMTDMDDYTRKYLADQQDAHPTVDLQAILQKLRESMRQQFPLVRDIFRKFDRDHNGVMTFEEFDDTLRKFSFRLQEQEVMALFRHFDKSGNGQVSYNEFCDTVLEKDYSMHVVPRQAPVHSNVTDRYVHNAAQKTRERGEQERCRKAVQAIGQLLYQKTHIIPRLRSILYRACAARDEQLVTASEIRSALLMLGHAFDEEDLIRALTFVMPGLDLERIPYNDLLSAFQASYQDCGAPR